MKSLFVFFNKTPPLWILFQRTNGVCQHLAFGVTGSGMLDRSGVKGETFVLVPGFRDFWTIIAEKAWKEHVLDLFRYWLARKPRVKLEPEDDITFKGIPAVTASSARPHVLQMPQTLSGGHETWVGGTFPIQTGALFLCSVVKCCDYSASQSLPFRCCK